MYHSLFLIFFPFLLFVASMCALPPIVLNK
jgi:hypothetical protein